MDEVINKAKELRLAIENTNEFKEYKKNKEALENSGDVIELKHNIARLKAQGKTIEAKNLESLYYSHPLVNNFEASKEALYELLNTITNIIK